MTTDGRTRVTMRCEFQVPDQVLAPEGEEGRCVEDVRRALDSDDRWSGSRVAAIRQADPDEGWHLDVWTIPLSGAIDDLAQTCRGVNDTVSSVVPGAMLLACTRSEG
jgi:hypothetical protein